MGGALSHHEWPASPDRVVQPWVDGKCAATSLWGTGSQALSPGDFQVRRWRVGNADGRVVDRQAKPVAHKSSRVKQRSAGLCRTGNEGCWLRQLWHRSG